MNVLALGDSLTTEALAFASIVIALLLGMVLVLILRTRSLPVCRNCGFPSVRRVHSRHRPLDTLARALFSLSASVPEVLTPLLLLCVPPGTEAFQQPASVMDLAFTVLESSLATDP